MQVYKFRCWQDAGEYSQMLISTNAVYTAIRHVLNISSWLGWSDGQMPNAGTAKPQEYFLMQFTGFVDKNNNEVFEDDVFYIDHNEQEKILCKVYFDNVKFNGWTAKPLDTTLPNLVPINELFIKPSSIEIIGNIWQNKELAIVVANGS